MVEPHIVIPVGEVERLEAIEKRFNSLKTTASNLDESLKNHICDHSKCEKEIADLTEKYEKLKVERNSEKLKADRDQQIFEQVKRKRFDDSENETIDEVEKPSSTQPNKPPWYYIGPLHHDN